MVVGFFPPLFLCEVANIQMTRKEIHLHSSRTNPQETPEPEVEVTPHKVHIRVFNAKIISRPTLTSYGRMAVLHLPFC